MEERTAGEWRRGGEGSPLPVCPDITGIISGIRFLSWNEVWLVAGAAPSGVHKDWTRPPRLPLKTRAGSLPRVIENILPSILCIHRYKIVNGLYSILNDPLPKLEYSQCSFLQRAIFPTSILPPTQTGSHICYVT